VGWSSDNRSLGPALPTAGPIHADAPHLTALVAQAQHHHQRLTESRAWQHGQLSVTITRTYLDGKQWQIATTALAIAEATHAVDQAAAHPDLTHATRHTQRDITEAADALRATVRQLEQLADAATTIDATHHAVHAEQVRQRHRDHAEHNLNRRRARLTTACGATDTELADSAAAATTAAQFASQHLNPPR
jgi:hypothetical protein